MQVQMTSCSKCLNCQGILFDEEIMAGWTAEDSNLNTKCLFCGKMMVPFLTIRVVDFRGKPCPTKEDPLQSTSEEKEDIAEDGDDPREDPSPAGQKEPPPPQGDSEKTGAEKETTTPPAANHNHRTLEPQLSVSDPITVPYLSPLVLRKELESTLEAEGDRCLLDAACVDNHPIIFWNLLWFFERIAVKSHLPGMCLRAGSLNRGAAEERRHPSWDGADHRNVCVKCRWDNERLHDSYDPPLYTLWKHQNVRKYTTKTICSLKFTHLFFQEDADNQSFNREHMVVMTEHQNPAYRAVMQHIISGVQNNDLLQVRTLNIGKDRPFAPICRMCLCSPSRPCWRGARRS